VRFGNLDVTAAQNDPGATQAAALPAEELLGKERVPVTER
jgi:hypothetical protein